MKPEDAAGVSVNLVTRLQTCLAVFLVACLAATAASSGRAAETTAKKKRGPQVIVVADVPEAMRGKVRPTRENPIYYIYLGSVERTLGSATGGEPLPDKETIRKAVEASLNSQGYVESHPGSPIPAIGIVVSWGEANLEDFQYQQTDDETGDTYTITDNLDLREIRQLVGADKASKKLLSEEDNQQLSEAVDNSRLYIVVGALDIAALKKKKKELVWRVRMSVEAVHNTLPEAMPVMLASAAPYFGREVDMPRFVGDTERSGRVTVGDVEVMDSDKDAPDAKAAPKEH